MEIKQRMERSLQILQDPSCFELFLEEKLQIIKKNYSISNINSLHGIVRLMTMCLIIDHFTLILNPYDVQIRILSQLNQKKEGLIKKIKEEQSILTMQGKMKQHSRSQSLPIVVIKLASEILLKNKQIFAQQQLFKRLNYLFHGVNISNKCYRLSLNRINNHNAINKQKQQIELKLSTPQKQSSEFKKLFCSLHNIKNEQKNNNQSSLKKQSLNDNHLKITNIINKVKKTIQSESKKFGQFEQKDGKNSKKPIKKAIDENESQIQEEKNPKQRRMSAMESRRKKNSRRSKRLGTINEHDKIKSRFKDLGQLILNEDNQSSYESVPCTNQNWYKPQNKIRMNRVYTLCLPGVTQLKYR